MAYVTAGVYRLDLARCIDGWLAGSLCQGEAPRNEMFRIMERFFESQPLYNVNALRSRGRRT